MKKIYLVIILVIFLISPVSSFAENKKIGLSAKARRALDRGIGFAQNQEWDQAIKSFEEAQALAPREPHCLLNLALAYERKGCEAISLYWYYAYLAAAPAADNVAMVEKKVEKVRLLLESKFKKCLQMSEKSLRELNEYYAKGDPEYFPLPNLSEDYNAHRIQRSLESADSIRAVAYHGVAFSAAILGEYKKAYEMADLILNCKKEKNFQENWEHAYEIIAHHQILRGDIEQALLTMKKIQDPMKIEFLYLHLAEKLAICLQFDAAKEYIQKAEAISNNIQKEEEKSSYYHNRVFIFLEMRDFANAKKAAELIRIEEMRKDDLASIKKRENRKNEDIIDDFISRAKNAKEVDFYRDLPAYLDTLKNENPHQIIWRLSQLTENTFYSLYNAKNLPCK